MIDGHTGGGRYPEYGVSPTPDPTGQTPESDRSAALKVTYKTYYLDNMALTTLSEGP